jgi:polysaccharide pyruvyl transferase WcaK-like protein
VHRKVYSRFSAYAMLVNWLIHRVWMRSGRRRADLLAKLSMYDFLVIGGGQLLRDNRLGFPTRLATIVEAAVQLDRPIAFFAVGVGQHWTGAGRYFFRKALTSPNVFSIDCRDANSVDRLEREIPSLHGKVGETVDAVLAKPNYDQERLRVDDSVGLCIMDTTVIHWTDRNHVFCDEQKAIEFWVRLIEVLSELGLKVRLFTNGSPVDHAFATEIERKAIGIDRANIDAMLLPRPTRPDMLVKLIGSFKSIVAFRLHANIAAFTLGVPSIALSWDDKVRQFMEYSGQLDRYVEIDESITNAVESVAKLVSQPANSNLQKPLAARVRSDLQNVFRGKT